VGDQGPGLRLAGPEAAALPVRYGFADLQVSGNGGTAKNGMD
jgi:hypothetical protein